MFSYLIFKLKFNNFKMYKNIIYNKYFIQLIV